MSHPVLELQAAQTMADQLAHRRARLPERDQVQAARNDLIRWDQGRQRLRQRLDELAGAVDQSESAAHDIDEHLARLQAQLRTVIAPREAEALQHQIASLHERRNALDDAELELLEEQSRLDDELTALLAQEPSLRDTLLATDAALSAAESDIDAELGHIAERLDGLRAAVDPGLLQRYDRLRTHFVVAAATLAGSRCEGCHLDLSAHEADAVKAEIAAGRVADCPQCGRLLLR
ncbi:MAG TPA: C4-type zinc ribbon domain-containing protein [Ilumatobacter sp.]